MKRLWILFLGKFDFATGRVALTYSSIRASRMLKSLKRCSSSRVWVCSMLLNAIGFFRDLSFYLITPILWSSFREMALGGNFINCLENIFSYISPLLLTLVLSNEFVVRCNLKLICFGYSFMGFSSNMSAKDVLSSSDSRL